jgi:hypothetical protein
MGDARIFELWNTEVHNAKGSSFGINKAKQVLIHTTVSKSAGCAGIQYRHCLNCFK